MIEDLRGLELNLEKVEFVTLAPVTKPWSRAP